MTEAALKTLPQAGCPLKNAIFLDISPWLPDKSENLKSPVAVAAYISLMKNIVILVSRTSWDQRVVCFLSFRDPPYRIQCFHLESTATICSSMLWESFSTRDNVNLTHLSWKVEDTRVFSYSEARVWTLNLDFAYQRTLSYSLNEEQMIPRKDWLEITLTGIEALRINMTSSEAWREWVLNTVFQNLE